MQWSSHPLQKLKINCKKCSKNCICWPINLCCRFWKEASWTNFILKLNHSGHFSHWLLIYLVGYMLYISSVTFFLLRPLYQMFVTANVSPNPASDPESLAVIGLVHYVLISFRLMQSSEFFQICHFSHILTIMSEKPITYLSWDSFPLFKL